MSRASSSYLLLYNTISLVSWTYQTLIILSHVTAATDSNNSNPSTSSAAAALRNDLFSLVTPLQSAAILDVVHAALGLVRASPGAAALQVGGRNLVLWTVMRAFLDLIFADGGGDSGYRGGGFGRAAFVTCLVAWGVADVLRFALFVANGLGWRCGWLRWLRYSAFIVLYPIGFLSEASLVYLGLVEGRGIGPVYRGYLFLGLLSYLPASYFLYTHMFSQRRRALAQAERAKET